MFNRTPSLLVLVIALACLLAPTASAQLSVVGGAADITSQSVDAELVDGFLRVVVRHEFAVRSFDVREGVYRFPLPEGAALTALALETGEMRLEGVLAERGVVERSYDSLLLPALRGRRAKKKVEERF